MTVLNGFSESKKTINILCVDDDLQILRSLKRSLRALDSNLHFANSGEEGVELLAQFDVDIILSDMKMPGMDGAEFLAHVADKHPRTKRLLMTGFSDVDAIIASINDGGIQHLLKKPWDSNQLVALFEKLIQSIRTEEENKLLKIALQRSRNALKKANEELEQKVKLRTQQIKQAVQKIQYEQKSTEKVLYNLLHTHPSYNPSLSRDVAHCCVALGQLLELTPQDSSYFYLGGLLHQLGGLTLDKELVELPRLTLNHSQQQLYMQQVNAIPLILSPVHHLADLQQMLCLQFEGYGRGKGFPRRLKGKAIPIAARVLHIARDYCAYLHGKMLRVRLNHSQALKEMKKQAGYLYDPYTLELLEHYSPSAHSEHDFTLSPIQLAPGMVLATPLFTENHVMLLSEGHIFSSSSIDRLVAYENNTNSEIRVNIRSDLH